MHLIKLRDTIGRMFSITFEMAQMNIGKLLYFYKYLIYYLAIFVLLSLYIQINI